MLVLACAHAHGMGVPQLELELELELELQLAADGADACDGRTRPDQTRLRLSELDYSWTGEGAKEWRVCGVARLCLARPAPSGGLCLSRATPRQPRSAVSQFPVSVPSRGTPMIHPASRKRVPALLCSAPLGQPRHMLHHPLRQAAFAPLTKCKRILQPLRFPRLDMTLHTIPAHRWWTGLGSFGCKAAGADRQRLSHASL